MTKKEKMIWEKSLADVAVKATSASSGLKKVASKILPIKQYKFDCVVVFEYPQVCISEGASKADARRRLKAYLMDNKNVPSKIRIKDVPNEEKR